MTLIDGASTADPTATEPATLIAGASPAPTPEAEAEAGQQPAAPEVPSPYLALTAENLATALPEGFVLEEARTAEVLEAINKGESRADIAKNLLGLYKSEVEKFQTAQAETWDNLQKEWQGEILNAPEYQGDKGPLAFAQAKETALQLGGQELLDLMNATGVGNNIHMLKALLKARELIPQEGTPVTGKPAVAPKSVAALIFDKS